MQKKVFFLRAWLLIYYLRNTEMEDFTVVWTMFRNIRGEFMYAHGEYLHGKYNTFDNGSFHGQGHTKVGTKVTAEKF